MKKVMMILIPLALAAVLVAVFFSPSYSAAGRMMMGRGGHHGMGKDFLFYRLDQVSKDLNLNAAQQAKMDTFKQDLSSLMDQRMEKRRQIHDVVREELSKQNPDISKITPLIDKQIDETAQLAHDMVRRIESLYNDLTPEQRKILADHVKERMDSRERWHD